jgi:hypothetical protein
VEGEGSEAASGGARGGTGGGKRRGKRQRRRDEEGEGAKAVRRGERLPWNRSGSSVAITFRQLTIPSSLLTRYKGATGESNGEEER